MPVPCPPNAGELSVDGFTILRKVFTRYECLQIARELQDVLSHCSDEATSLRRSNGAIYGARNLIAIFPAAKAWWQKAVLIDFLTQILGPEFGLVRGLFFDKPPDGNWSLPWHQDLTIAVADHTLPSEHFRNRTKKAGVPHVEAADELLRQMLTLRIHLDDVTNDNGPLQVLPGTHIGRNVEPAYQPPVTILATAGDVLAMRPLLSHSSGPSITGTTRHRRVIHLEFAASPELPDGYRWHEFHPGISR